MKTPEFWYAPSGLLAAALSPAAWIYGCAAACVRARKTPWRAPVPVISVGNLTAGGAGKTPVALELTARLQAQGGRPAVVLRGYGAAVKGALQVDAARHDAADAGDEALLHAKGGPTWVSPDRRAGAEAAIAAGCDMIVLDDAHQNRDLHKTLSIVVINGADGFGNARMIPAGPLREPVQAGLARADAVIILGEDKHNCAAYTPESVKVIAADVAPDAAARALAGETCAAFAGVARPEKVFTAMRGAGLKIISTHAFADHHAYTQGELARLRKTAAGARLVTTTKDWVRLPASARGDITPFGVRVVWRDESEIDALLAGARNNA